MLSYGTGRSVALYMSIKQKYGENGIFCTDTLLGEVMMFVHIFSCLALAYA